MVRLCASQRVADMNGFSEKVAEIFLGVVEWCYVAFDEYHTLGFVKKLSM